MSTRNSASNRSLGDLWQEIVRDGDVSLLNKLKERCEVLADSDTPGRVTHSPWNDSHKGILKDFRRAIARHIPTSSPTTGTHIAQESKNPVTVQGQPTQGPSFTALISIAIPLVLLYIWTRTHSDNGQQFFDLVNAVQIGFASVSLTQFVLFLARRRNTDHEFRIDGHRIFRNALLLGGTLQVGLVLLANQSRVTNSVWQFLAWPVAVTVLVDVLYLLDVRLELLSTLNRFRVTQSQSSQNYSRTRRQRRAQMRVEEQSHIYAVLTIIAVVHVLLTLTVSYLFVLVTRDTPTAENVREAVFVSVALVISSCIAVGVALYSTTHERLLQTRREFRSTLREIQRLTYELDRSSDHLWRKFRDEIAGVFRSLDEQSPTDEQQHSLTDEQQVYQDIYLKRQSESSSNGQGAGSTQTNPQAGQRHKDQEKVEKFCLDFGGRFHDQWQATIRGRDLLAEQCKRAPVNFHDFCEDLELFDKLFRYLDSADSTEHDLVTAGKILSRLHLYSITFNLLNNLERSIGKGPGPNTVSSSHETLLHAVSVHQSSELSDGDLSTDHPAHHILRFWSRIRQIRYSINADHKVESLTNAQFGELILLLELSRNRGPILNWIRAALGASRRSRFQHYAFARLEDDHFLPQTIIGLRIMPTTSLQWSWLLHMCGMPDSPVSPANQRLKVMSLDDIDK
jgi:hypothetical protein